jgi:hypothetical protein
LQECVVPQIVIRPGGAATISAKIESFKWTRLRCRIKVEGTFDGCKVDLRDKAADPATSIAEETKVVGSEGLVSLVVKPDMDSREGTASLLVLLDPAGNIIEKTPVTVGG